MVPDIGGKFAAWQRRNGRFVTVWEQWEREFLKGARVAHALKPAGTW
jgi:hypothetical protein